MPTSTSSNTYLPTGNAGDFKTTGEDTIPSLTNNIEGALTTPLMETPVKKNKLSTSNHRRIVHEQKKDSGKNKSIA